MDSDKGLLTIALNRPKRFNALDRSMYDGIIAALDSTHDNHDIKAVLIKSTGPMFSSESSPFRQQNLAQKLS